MSVIEGQGLPGTPTQTVLTVQGHPDGLPLLVNVVAGPNGTAQPDRSPFIVGVTNEYPLAALFNDDPSADLLMGTTGAVRATMKRALHVSMRRADGVEAAHDESGTIVIDGVAHPVLLAFANVASGAIDAVLVSAVSGKAIRVLALVVQCGAKATTVTFTSKPTGAGTVISPALQYGANGGQVWPENRHGWFQTSLGDGLAATTSVSAVTTGVQLIYVLV